MLGFFPTIKKLGVDDSLVPFVYFHTTFEHFFISPIYFIYIYLLT